MDTDSTATWSDAEMEEGEEVSSEVAPATCFLSSVVFKRPPHDDDDDVAPCAKKLRGFACEDGGDSLALGFPGSFVDELGELFTDVRVEAPPLPFVPFRPEVDARAAKMAHTFPRHFGVQPEDLLRAPLPSGVIATPPQGYVIGFPKGDDAFADLMTSVHVDALHRAMEKAAAADELYECAAEVCEYAAADRDRMRIVAAKWGLANKAMHDHSVFAAKYNAAVSDLAILSAPPEGLYADGWEQLWLQTVCPSCCGVTPNGEYIFGFMSHCTISGAPWDADPSTVLHDYDVVVLAPWPGKYLESCVA
jgi:hypothetical protein